MHHSSNEFSLFVGDLPLDCSDDKLQRLFQQKYKSVKRVQIIRNEDGTSRGFGFIRFEDRNELNVARVQEMKIGNVSLRLDLAHTKEYRFKNNRSRYNSFNSTGAGNNNNNNHHNHHFNTGGNNHHHHQHHNQQHHHQPQSHHQHGNQHLNMSNKGLNSESGSKIVHPHNTQPANNVNQALASGSSTTSVSSNHQSVVSVGNNNAGHHHPIHQHQQQQQQTSLSNQNSHSNHNHYTPLHQLNNTSQHQSSLDNNTNKNLNKKQPQSHLPSDGTNHSVTSAQSYPQPVQPISLTHPPQSLATSAQVIGPDQTQVQAPTSESSGSNVNISNQTLPNAPTSNHNLTSSQQAIGPDIRGFTTGSNLIDSHLLNASDQPSIMPPTSVYGQFYPYGPSPFGYLPTQGNPVLSMPGVAPNQTSPSSSLSQQSQGQSHHPGASMPTATQSARYNQTGNHHPHHHQQSHQGDTSNVGLNTLAGGMQAAHQAPPLYYYYPSPLYFDQAGGAAAPPNLYHTQTFHPHFFAMPNPAYMPNAHNYSHQQQPASSAAQSEPSIMNPQTQQSHQHPPQHHHPQQQQQPQAHQPHQPHHHQALQQPQQHQPPQQVIRTRDIETTID